MSILSISFANKLTGFETFYFLKVLVSTNKLDQEWSRKRRSRNGPAPKDSFGRPNQTFGDASRYDCWIP